MSVDPNCVFAFVAESTGVVEGITGDPSPDVTPSNDLTRKNPKRSCGACHWEAELVCSSIAYFETINGDERPDERPEFAGADYFPC